MVSDLDPDLDPGSEDRGQTKWPVGHMSIVDQSDPHYQSDPPLMIGDKGSEWAVAVVVADVVDTVDTVVVVGSAAVAVGSTVDVDVVVVVVVAAAVVAVAVVAAAVDFADQLYCYMDHCCCHCHYYKDNPDSLLLLQFPTILHIMDTFGFFVKDIQQIKRRVAANRYTKYWSIIGKGSSNTRC